MYIVPYCAEQKEAVVTELRTKLRTTEERLQATNRGINLDSNGNEK